MVKDTGVTSHVTGPGRFGFDATVFSGLCPQVSKTVGFLPIGSMSGTHLYGHPSHL